MATYYVEQIRSVDSRGPYALVGLCFGAVVAYEMAQQILRAGQEVELLCMLDPDPPDYVAVEPPFRRRLQVKWTVFRNQRLSDRIPYLFGQAKNATIRIGELVKLRVLGNTPAPAGDVEVANFEAIRKYEPRPYPALVTLFRASERPETEYASQMDWRRYATVGLAVEEVPGNHLSMMKEPYVQSLASKLEARLRKASATATTLCGLAMAV
jgi:aspartate racemase